MSSPIEKLSRTVAERQGLRVSKIDIRPGSNKGDGLLGDIYMVTVTDVEGKKLDIVVKSATDNEVIVKKYRIPKLYDNEQTFYQRILPELKRFQTAKQVLHPFGQVADYYGSHFSGNVQLIALENLKSDGFVMFDKKSTVDGDHVEKVFAEYGRLHGVSLVYRHEDPEGFQRLTGDLHNGWSFFQRNSSFTDILNGLSKDINIYLEEANEKSLVEPFQKYLHADVIFKDVSEYTGNYFTLTHGDCWTNNLMFKYKSHDDGTKQLDSIRLLDWQLTRVASPVHDLSYFLYSSSSKEIFDNLNHYLEVYYESLSKTVKDLGCQPDALYPFHVLKSDWKKYSPFGLILGFLMNRLKLTYDKDVVDLHDTNKVDTNGQPPKKIIDANYDVEVFKTRTLNLVRHMFDIGAL